MIRRPPISTRTDTLFPYTTLFRSVSALYKIDPDVSLYATVRRGYRAGGFNPAASTPELLAYRPETVTDYEIGVKSRWEIGGWKLRANVDLLYDDYKDIQRLVRSEEHTSELQSLMRISYAVFCLKKTKIS